MPGLIFPFHTSAISSGRYGRTGAGPAVQVDVLEEQLLLPVERDPVRDADIAHVPARTGGTDRLLHRLLGADALQHRIGAEPVGPVHDAGHALVAKLGG